MALSGVYDIFNDSVEVTGTSINSIVINKRYQTDIQDISNQILGNTLYIRL